MVLARVGPLTTTFEAAATAVTAGVVLGSFAMGILGLVRGWPRKEIAARALTDGYVGGFFGAALALADLVLRYGG
jgi:hypothetical protein